MRLLLFLVTFSTITITTTRARADAGSEARRHFDAGNAAYSHGEFLHAAKEYEAAFAEKQDPTFLYDIAQAYRLGGDPTQAISFYRSYLRKQPMATNRRDVAERIVELERQRAAAVAPVTPSSNAPAPAKRIHDPHQTPPIIPRGPERPRLTPDSAATISRAPATPTGLTVNGAGAICVSWTAVAGASSYYVYYSPVAGGAKAGHGRSFTSTTTSGSVPDLDADTVYYFSVSAENASGRSARSAEVASKAGAPACL